VRTGLGKKVTELGSGPIGEALREEFKSDQRHVLLVSASENLSRRWEG